MSDSEYSADEKLPSDKYLEKGGVEANSNSVDLEKGPPSIFEDVEGIREEPLARHVTNIAHLINLEEGVVGWDNQKDPQNPLWVLDSLLTKLHTDFYSQKLACLQATNCDDSHQHDYVLQPAGFLNLRPWNHLHYG